MRKGVIKKLEKIQDFLFKDRFNGKGIDEINFEELKRNKIDYDVNKVRSTTSFRSYLKRKFNN